MNRVIPSNGKLGLSGFELNYGMDLQVSLQGNVAMNLEGNFGDAFAQVGYWQENLPFEVGEEMSFWLEYETEGEVEVALQVDGYLRYMPRGEGSHWILENMAQIQRIHSDENQMIAISVLARGEGRLRLVALHFNREGKGSAFLRQRFVGEKREELVLNYREGVRVGAHSNLADSLAVVFLGDDEESDEALVQSLMTYGVSILLLQDTRLISGAFFIGSKEYEALVETAILGIVERQQVPASKLLFLGNSMGAYGALYYGSKFRAENLLLCKPILNIEEAAKLQKHKRPTGFETSLDVVNLLEETGDFSEKLWNAIEQSEDWKSKWKVIHLLEDDYDPRAYQELISRITSGEIEIRGKGIHGRHMDSSREVIRSMQENLKQMMQENFYE